VYIRSWWRDRNFGGDNSRFTGRQERDSYETGGAKRSTCLKQQLSAHAITAACHDRVDTFDTALMGHSLALQRLNEIKLSNGAQSWHARCIFPVERYCRGGKRAAMIKA
jgi:hypothetical protein